MKHEVASGQTDYTVLVKIRDDAGAAATGLTNSDIDIAYARVETDNDVTTSDVTPAALSALTDAHTDWGFKEVSATDHPGLYRLDIADAVFASGAWSAVVTITGTGLDPADLEFVMVPVSPLTGVKLASTGLDAITAWTVAITGNITGNLSGSVGSVTGAVGSVTGAVGSVTGSVGSVATGGITASSFAAGAIDAAALAADASTEIVTALFATAVETGVTFQQWARYVGAVLAGERADAGTGTATWKAVNNSGTTRVTCTASGGNRSGFTLNG